MITANTLLPPPLPHFKNIACYGVHNGLIYICGKWSNTGMLKTHSENQQQYTVEIVYETMMSGIYGFPFQNGTI